MTVCGMAPSGMALLEEITRRRPQQPTVTNTGRDIVRPPLAVDADGCRSNASTRVPSFAAHPAALTVMGA